MGEVTLKTRSMLWNRSGRPRSEMSRTGEIPTPAKASSQPRRASAGRPDIPAPSASGAAAPAIPPTKKYQGTSGVHTGVLSTCRPW